MLTWECDNCGFTSSLEDLAKQIVDIKYDNDIYETRVVLAIEEESYEWEQTGEDEYRSWESYYFRCPKCRHREEWYYEEYSNRVFERLSVQIKLPDGRTTRIAIPKTRSGWKRLIL